MKKLILSLLILSSLLTLNGCNNSNNIVKDNNGNTKNESEYMKDDCMVWCQMMWNGNKSNSDRSKSEMEKDCRSLCEAGQAIQDKDLKSCDKSEWILKDSCISSIAQDTNDTKACDKITEPAMKRACYAGLADKLKDKKICDNVEEGMWRSSCVEWAKSE